jgi:hypothetical protein
MMMLLEQVKHMKRKHLPRFALPEVPVARPGVKRKPTGALASLPYKRRNTFVGVSALASLPYKRRNTFVGVSGGSFAHAAVFASTRV